MSKEAQHYPTWRYHKTEKAILVKNAEEHKALGEGWTDAPHAETHPASKHHAESVPEVRAPEPEHEEYHGEHEEEKPKKKKKA